MVLINLKFGTQLKLLKIIVSGRQPYLYILRDQLIIQRWAFQICFV